MGNVPRVQEFFDTVYEETFPLLFRIAYHITGCRDSSEDICQEAYIRYFNRLMPLPSLNETRYWLIRVVKNLCYNHEKRKVREQRAYRKFLLSPQKVEETGETLTLKNETEKIIRDALQFLPPKFRYPLVLKEYGDMNYKNIGKILGITESNVKVRIFRARQSLEKILQKEELHVS